MEQEGDQRGVSPGDEAFRPLRTPPPREQALAVTGKISSQMALVSHSSEDQAVLRHKQQTKATHLVHFSSSSLALASSAPGTELLMGG